MPAPQLTIIEQRRDKRAPLAHRPPGAFQLKTPETTYPIDVIRDISSSGIRVYLPAALTKHLRVVVEYIEPAFKLEVNGMVVWCKARAPDAAAEDSADHFVVGIQLLSPLLLMAMSEAY